MIWDVLESDENGEMDGVLLLWAGFGGFEFEDTMFVAASIVFVNG